MTANRPDVTRVQGVLRYDPQTGTLTWKPRVPDMFPGTERQRQRYCDLWNNSFAGKPALSTPDMGYRSGSLFGKKALAHRVAWALYHGRWPEHQIDHINGVRDDNRIENLREVTATVNKRNARLDRRNKSGVTGVCYDSHNQAWVARVTRERKRLFLGMFEHFENAVAARKSAEQGSNYAVAHGTSERPYYVHHRDKKKSRASQAK